MKIYRIISAGWLAALAMAGGIFPLGVNAGQVRVIEEAHLNETPYGITVKLNEKTPYKAVQVDKREVLIAFKNARLSKNFRKSASDNRLLERIKIESLANNVVTVIVNADKELTAIHPQWIRSRGVLFVRLISRQTPATVDNVAPAVQKKQTEREKENLPKLSEYISAPRSPKTDKKPSSSVDGLLAEIKTDACMQAPDIREAVTFCEEESWQNAIRILKQRLEAGASDPCLEKAYYLKAYSFYKMNVPGPEAQNMEAANLFQEAVSFYPESKLAPYSMTALGKIYLTLKNYVEAKGYFTMVLEKFTQYSGVPEVMLDLGRVYARDDKLKLAISTFREVTVKYPDSKYVADANLELGKVLFEANDFSESLKVLTGLLKSDPYKIFESADLLKHIGNSFYQMGKYEEAREALSMVYNYFPAMESNHMVLARIGDTYRDEKQPEKAREIYKYVMEKFPGTDGFIISAMRLADSLERREEKESVYNMVIADYPTSPMAKLAQLKLAELQNKVGEYEKSIETIRTLLATNPVELKKEAVYLMQESFKSFFGSFLLKDDYPGLLARFEKDKRLFNNFDDPELFLMIGKAYLKGSLYDKAAETLQKSYRLFDAGKQPTELILSLGIALQESGRADLALGMFNTYIRVFPAKAQAGEAYIRKGRILLAKKEYDKAIQELKSAYKLYKKGEDQAAILMDEAEGYKGLGDFKEASALLIQAINLMAASPENSFDSIFLAYRRLGETYLELKSYLKAADSFAMALKFGNKDGDVHPDLSFMLGESYHKGKALDMAEKIFKEIVAAGDPFWGKLAEEKLRGIRLEEKLKKT